jgi:hypothetical protein
MASLCPCMHDTPARRVDMGTKDHGRVSTESPRWVPTVRDQYGVPVRIGRTSMELNPPAPTSGTFFAQSAASSRSRHSRM